MIRRPQPPPNGVPSQGRPRPRRRRLPKPLDAHLGYWLRYVSNQVMHALARRFEELGLTVAEWVVLRELYEGERRPATLAEKLGLTRGAISKLAVRLEAKQMITQRAYSRDGRAQILALTEIGRATLPTLATIAEQNDETFFGELEPRTREIIIAALRETMRRRGSQATPAGWI